jgi:hypothetical protein
MCLFTAGVVLILLGLTFASDQLSWDSPLVISSLTLGVALFTTFIFYNARLSKNALVPHVAIRTAGVLFPVLGMLFTFASLYGVIYFVSIYFQVIQRASPLQSGINLLPLIISLILTSVICGILIAKTGYTKPLLVVGTAVLTLGLGLLGLLGKNSNTGYRVGLLILPGAGIGLLAQTFLLSAQTAIPRGANEGVLFATALIQFGRSLGGALSTVIGQVVLNASLSSLLKDQNGISDIKELMNNPSLIFSQPQAVQDEIINAYVEAFHDVIWFFTGLSAVAFIMALFCTNKKVEKTTEQVSTETREDVLSEHPATQ